MPQYSTKRHAAADADRFRVALADVERRRAELLAALKATRDALADQVANRRTVKEAQRALAVADKAIASAERGCTSCGVINGHASSCRWAPRSTP